MEKLYVFEVKNEIEKPILLGELLRNGYSFKYVDEVDKKLFGLKQISNKVLKICLIVFEMLHQMLGGEI